MVKGFKQFLQQSHANYVKLIRELRGKVPVALYESARLYLAENKATAQKFAKSKFCRGQDVWVGVAVISANISDGPGAVGSPEVHNELFTDFELGLKKLINRNTPITEADLRELEASPIWQERAVNIRFSDEYYKVTKDFKQRFGTECDLRDEYI